MDSTAISVCNQTLDFDTVPILKTKILDSINLLNRAVKSLNQNPLFQNK